MDIERPSIRPARQLLAGASRDAVGRACPGAVRTVRAARERGSSPAMRQRSSTVLALVLASLGLFALGGCGKSGDAALSPKQAATDAEKLKGKKIKVAGVYTQGFSKGGRPTDPWALVIGDAPGVQPTVSCVVPAKVDLGSKYPKITAEGTVSIEAGGRVYLTGCTYKMTE